MKLSDYKATYENTSKILSDLNRKMALAGIAIIWTFTKTDTNVILPNDLFLPSILLASSLLVDMMQYIYKTIAFYISFRTKEKKNNDKTIEYKNNIWMVRFVWFFFWIKIILMFSAYFFILKFLYYKLI